MTRSNFDASRGKHFLTVIGVEHQDLETRLLNVAKQQRVVLLDVMRIDKRLPPTPPEDRFVHKLGDFNGVHAAVTGFQLDGP